MLARYWALVDDSGDGCWIWQGLVGNSGYGRFTTARKHLAYAHRVAYEIHHAEEIPVGMQVDHLCHVKLCVNPSHLRVVTPRTNTNSQRKPRARITHCPQGHAYEGGNLLEYTDRKGYTRRSCRACRTARNDARPRKRAQQTTTV